MQSRAKRGSHHSSEANSDEISFDSSSENKDESESDFSGDGVKSGANSVQTSPAKAFSFRSKAAPSADSHSNENSPKKEKDPPRRPSRPRRNSNLSEESGITSDKKNKAPANADKNNISKQKKAAASDNESSDDEKNQKDDESDRSGHENGNHSDSDESMHDDSDASGPQDESSGYESESESGEVRKKRTSRSRDSSVRRRDQDDGRKHYPKRAVHKIAHFEPSTSRPRTPSSSRVRVDPEKTVLTRAQMKALDHIANQRNATSNRNNTHKSPSSLKTHTSTSHIRESLRERRPPSSSLQKLDEMISESMSSEESDFDDDGSTNIRRSKRVRKSVDRFQPSPSKKEREREKRRARQEARARGKSYNSDGSSTYSSDEYQEFREKATLTLKPINVKPRDQIAVGPNRNTTIGDITPMDIDKSINWSSVGGLDHHIKALKEMVLFPLLYPEIFQRFQITPPKGVLFYGPPGTGKTLVARALANTCTNGSGQKISFFMRKGADILSKWVGEAERQLRLLFDEARRLQPSIVFFDEIDGLAPVRSSKQDQIHSSIVSTLLALMDGLDNRGQVIVIGATNRIDAIDPALRRPGRFDREFLFTLPSKVSRREIMNIHTEKWDPPINMKLRDDIADHCVGYCGADLKALCSEAVLNALRRNYPQIYERDQKLLLDPSKIIVSSHDFIKAMKSITPASHRSVAIHARPLLRELQPLLEKTFNSLMSRMKKVFPFGSSLEQLDKEFEIIDPSKTTKKGDENAQEIDRMALETELYDLEKRYTTQQVFRPRLLITGHDGNGQSHLGAALLHQLEEFPVFSADLSTLHADLFSRSLEEAFVTRFNETIKKLPAVLFIPHLDTWWNLATPALQESFLTSMKDIEPTLPLLLVATADSPLEKLPEFFRQVFATDNIVESDTPTEEARTEFFADIFKLITKPALRKRKRRKMKDLPLAPPPAPRELSPEERETQRQSDEHYLRLLRMEIRDILDKIRGQRKYQNFFKPMSLEMYPDYYEVVKEPMDLLTIQRRNDENYYITFDMFLDDLNLVMSNAKLYFNEHNDQHHLLSKVRAMSDLISALLIEVSKETVINCIEIAKSERVAQGKKVPPQLPPKPMPVDMVNGTHVAPVSREAESRRHSARLKGETIAEDVLQSYAEDAVREKRRKKRDLLEATQKGQQGEPAEADTSDHEEESKDNERSHKSKKDRGAKSRENGISSKKSRKRKRDEEDEENTPKSTKRPRTDSNLSRSTNTNTNKSPPSKKNVIKDEEKEEKSTVDLSVDDSVVEEKSAKDCVVLTSNNNNNTNDNQLHEKITFSVDPDVKSTNENSNVEQMQVVVEEESESEEEPIQPIEIDHKELARFKVVLLNKTAGMTVDQLHSVFVALQNCAYEERFNHQRTVLISTMKKALSQFVPKSDSDLGKK